MVPVDQVTMIVLPELQQIRIMAQALEPGPARDQMEGVMPVVRKLKHLNVIIMQSMDVQSERQ